MSFYIHLCDHQSDQDRERFQDPQKAPSCSSPIGTHSHKSNDYSDFYTIDYICLSLNFRSSFWSRFFYFALCLGDSSMFL